MKTLFATKDNDHKIRSITLLKMTTHMMLKLSITQCVVKSLWFMLFCLCPIFNLTSTQANALFSFLCSLVVFRNVQIPTILISALFL